MNSHANSTKSYTTHSIVLLTFTVVLGVFAFLLVIHHRDVPERVHEEHAIRR